MFAIMRYFPVYWTTSLKNGHSVALIVISGESHQKFWPNLSFGSSLFCRRNISETKMLKPKLRANTRAEEDRGI